jgi:hypothetical protein
MFATMKTLFIALLPLVVVLTQANSCREKTAPAGPEPSGQTQAPPGNEPSGQTQTPPGANTGEQPGAPTQTPPPKETGEQPGSQTQTPPAGNEEECLQDKPESSQATVPATARVGQPVSFDVKFSARNGCGRFHELKDQKSGKTIDIQAIVRYKGCVCTDAMKNLSAPYTFTPSEAGTYTVRFWQHGGKYVEKQIRVE